MTNIRKLIDKDFYCEYDLIIISPGGTTQTFVMNEILKQKPNNYAINSPDDLDNLKHISSPENSVFNCNKVHRVLYIFNNTLLSILSNFRRGFYKMQYKKISKFIDFNEKYLFNNKNELFEELEKTNSDISNVSKHFYNWFNYTGNIYFLDVNNINTNKLDDFLGFQLNLTINNSLRHIYNDIPEFILNFYKKIDDDIKQKLDEKYSKNDV